MPGLTYMHGQVAYQIAEMIDEKINIFNGEAFCRNPDHAPHIICNLTGFMTWVADHYTCPPPEQPCPLALDGPASSLHNQHHWLRDDTDPAIDQGWRWCTGRFVRTIPDDRAHGTHEPKP